MNPIEEYYGKFNEEKRFDSRHGQVEYRITSKYINQILEDLLREREKSEIKIFDIGAGTGRYCIPLAEEGYDVSAIELVKHNLSRLRAKSDKVKARQGDARNLKKYADNEFDVTLLFGPMYHLFSHEDKLACLNEAKRVTKPGGHILVAYCMNEYGVVMYALKEGHLKELVEEKRLTSDYHCVSQIENLYDYVRIEDINLLVEDSELIREKIITPDGPTNYIRSAIKAMTDEEFELYIKYVESIAERKDSIGAAAHTVDILIKKPIS